MLTTMSLVTKLNQVTYAQKVRWIRRVLRLRQRDLARILNVTPGAICQWERAYFVPEGANQQVIEALYRQAKKKRTGELQKIGDGIVKGLVAGAAIAGFIALLAALFEE